MQLQHIVITATQCNDYECNTLGLCYTHITATHCNCNTLVSLQRPDDARLQILANNTGGWAGVEQAHCNTVQLRHTVITATLCNCNILISLQRTDSAHAYRFWRRRQGGGLVWSRQRHCGASYSRTLRLCLLHSTPAGRCGVCCSVLQCVAGCCIVLQCAALQCSVLQCVAVCCSVLQCVAECCRCSCRAARGRPDCLYPVPKLKHLATTNSVDSSPQTSSSAIAVCCSVLQCVAVCCSVLQCVAVCCSESALLHQHHKLYRLGRIKERGHLYDRVCCIVCNVSQRVAACCSVLAIRW